MEGEIVLTIYMWKNAYFQNSVCCCCTFWLSPVKLIGTNTVIMGNFTIHFDCTVPITPVRSIPLINYSDKIIIMMLLVSVSQQTQDFEAMLV